MHLETIGHASLLLSLKNKKPLLMTDPWIVGSAYWRSWWLQNYPTKEVLDNIAKIPFVYVTHEHPDHMHTPSLKRFETQTKFLFPDLPQRGFETYMKGNNYNYQTLEILNWVKISPDVQLLSIPLWNDDSILLINTKNAFIINLNDAKPSNITLRWIKKIRKNFYKKTIMLSSYSPASIVNSFRRKGEELSIKSKEDYVKYLNYVCNFIEPDYFVPFASQVIFRREDSKWANQHKVTINDLQKYWQSKTKLLNPYSKINLSTFEVSYLDEKDYNPPSKISKELASKKEFEERNEIISNKEIEKLSAKLKKFSLIFRYLFPNGLGLKLDDSSFVINWKKRKIIEKGTSPNVDFTIDVPTGAMKDAINFNHIGDLGITMFTIVHLSDDTKLSPKRIYLFLILLTLDDYNHTKNLGSFLNWVKSNLSLLFKILFFPLPLIKG